MVLYALDCKYILCIVLCLEKWRFNHVRLVSSSHIPRDALYFLSFTNTCLSLYWKLERPILKEPLGSSDTHQTSGRAILYVSTRLSTLLMQKWSIFSDSDLNRGTERILRSRFGFVLKLGLLPVSKWQWGEFPIFSVFKYGSWCRRTWVHLL